LTPEQAPQLRLQGHFLSLENGGSLDLSPLFSTDNDRQQLSLSDTELQLERGGRVDLAPLLKKLSSQKIDRFELVGTTLELSLSSDEEQPHQMNLDSINTDNQQLSLTDTTLSLEEGGQIDLSPFYDNTDAQTLTMSIPTSRTLNLEIQHGNSITLESSGNLSFLKTSSDTAVFHLTESPFSLIQNTVSNQNQQWMLDDFVFGSPQLDNDDATTQDNKRMFFDKSKAAFRVGMHRVTNGMKPTEEPILSQWEETPLPLAITRPLLD